MNISDLDLGFIIVKCKSKRTIALIGMSEVIELTSLLSHAILTFLGVLIVILILRVYSLYRIMKINRSVMTPMLFAGFFIAISGITELTRPIFGEFGHIIHTIAMLLAAAFFAYGVYGYHQMLGKVTKLR